MEFVWKSKRWPGAVSHILYSDHHLPFLKLFSTLPRNLWGTLHFPPSQWTEAMFAGLKHLSFAITLYQRDIGAFERYAGKDRVRFVHYGVDTEFFRPGGNKIDAAPRVLYGGLYLRNTGMLARVIRKLHSAHPSLRFDLLVPERARADPDLQPLRGHPAVAWHAGLDDEQLRELYRQSQVLLLPINESGANTTVVEALACGLPIVTTDVGGIRDYGGGTLFPLVANDDDDAMVALVEAYLSRPAWRDEVAMKGRQFAEETLAWPLIARRHLALYKELAE
jgi:glycosyltransferase involved in cell wall biosynthesis